jgi:type VI secretion system secreted protein VgrG
MAWTTDLTGQDLGSLPPLAPGVYRFSSTAQLTGTLTLSGSATDVWVFQIGTALNTAGAAIVNLVGANAGNVYWQVGSSATLGGTNSFKGNIIAAASITLGTGTNLTGRVLSKVDVTMDTNIITLP